MRTTSYLACKMITSITNRTKWYLLFSTWEEHIIGDYIKKNLPQAFIQPLLSCCTSLTSCRAPFRYEITHSPRLRCVLMHFKAFFSLINIHEFACLFFKPVPSVNIDLRIGGRKDTVLWAFCPSKKVQPTQFSHCSAYCRTIRILQNNKEHLWGVCG